MVYHFILKQYITDEQIFLFQWSMAEKSTKRTVSLKLVKNKKTFNSCPM